MVHQTQHSPDTNVVLESLQIFTIRGKEADVGKRPKPGIITTDHTQALVWRPWGCKLRPLPRLNEESVDSGDSGLVAEPQQSKLCRKGGSRPPNSRVCFVGDNNMKQLYNTFAATVGGAVLTDMQQLGLEKIDSVSDRTGATSYSPMFVSHWGVGRGPAFACRS